MVERTVLDSGLVVISEFQPHSPSFSLSYSLRTGSRNESLSSIGIHHFVEHMIFKGSHQYDMKAIADISDRLGGSLNAFTGKEITQYYIKAVDGKLKESFDLLTDIVMNSVFLTGEFDKEKGVLLQEIKESDDDPDTFVFERFYESVFGRNGLAYPIGGKEEQVAAFTRDMVYDFYRKTYTPPNLLLAAVGNVQHRELVELAKQAFAAFPQQEPGRFDFQAPDFHWGSFSGRNKSLKQLYTVIGFAGVATASPVRYEFMIMNDILGGGMSSRLFQSMREEKGLAYTVNSFLDAYLECGIHLVYAILDPAHLDEYLAGVKAEIFRLQQEGISKVDLERACDHTKASILLSLESNTAKMRFNVNQDFFFGRELTVEEIIRDIDRLTVADINRVCRDYLDWQKATLFLYGDLPAGKKSRYRLDHY